MNPLRYKVKLNIRPNLGMFNFAKGVLMLMIIFSHSVSGYSFWEQEFFRETFIGFLMRGSNKALSYAVVPAFFIIGGYGFRKVSMKKCIRQMNVLVISYVITSLSIALLKVLQMVLLQSPETDGWITNFSYDILPFLFGMSPKTENFFGLRMQEIGVCWFLVAYYFSTIILNTVLRINGEKVRGLIFVLLSVAGISLRNMTVPFCLLQAMVGSGYMYLGYLLKKKKSLSKEIPLRFILLLLTVWCILADAGFMSMNHNMWKNGILDWACSCIAGAMLVAFLLMTGRSDGALESSVRWIGGNSFLLCFVHTVSLKAVQFFNIKAYYENAIGTGIFLEILFHCIFCFGITKLILCLIQLKRDRMMT